MGERESLKAVLRAAEDAMRWQALSRKDEGAIQDEQAWRARAKRIEEIATQMPTRYRLLLMIAALDWAARQLGDIEYVGDLRKAAGLLRALAGEEG